LRLGARSTLSGATEKDLFATQPGLPPGWIGGSENETDYKAGIDRKVSSKTRSPRSLRHGQCMAENVAWNLEHAPKGSKIVLWAHNGHVSRQPGAMGSYLAKRFGKDMVVFGFASHEGMYTAINPGKGLVDDNRLQLPPPGSIEWHLHRTGHARCVLDLRKSVKAAEGKWLDQPLLFRMVGALSMTQQFFPAKVTAQYDALIWFDRRKRRRASG
jgi:erythromycin esterase